jgi:hypothetical protein
MNSASGRGAQRAAQRDVCRGRARRPLPLLRPRFVQRGLPIPPVPGGGDGDGEGRGEGGGEGGGGASAPLLLLDEVAFDAACDGPRELRTVPMWVARCGREELSSSPRHPITAVLFLHGKTERRDDYLLAAARWLSSSSSSSSLRCRPRERGRRRRQEQQQQQEEKQEEEDGSDEDDSGLVLFALPDMPYHGDRVRRERGGPAAAFPAVPEFEAAVARAARRTSQQGGGGGGGGDDADTSTTTTTTAKTAAGPLLLDWAWDALCALDALAALYAPAPSRGSAPPPPPMRVVLAGASMGGSAALLAALAALAAAEEEEGGEDSAATGAWQLVGVGSLIALQYWRRGFEGDEWLGRAESLGPAFAAALEEEGEPGGGGGGGDNSSSSRQRRAWEAAVRRLLPGLLAEESYDAPHALAALRAAQVPLLACCSATDPRCPVEGVAAAWREAEEANSGGGDNSSGDARHELFVDEAARGHELTPAMMARFEAWLDGLVF